MRIVIPGGTGQIGGVLARAFQGDGHDVTVLSRGANGDLVPWRVVEWDGKTLGPWASELDGADVVINLAGRSVNCRYGVANRAAILDSRVDSTRVVGEAIAAAAKPPRLWLQSGTSTIYAHSYETAYDETGLIATDETDAPDTWRFSVGVAKSWEAALEAAPTPNTRKVSMRTSMTMSPDPGGVFEVLLGLVRKGLGGSVAGGKQYVSWIHGDDFVRATRFVIDREELSGPVNFTAPEPLSYADFMAALRKAWGVSIGLPATRWMLEIGCFVLRTESELVLKSRRVVPGKLQEAGFLFTHPRWPEAARDLCGRYRAGGG